MPDPVLADRPGPLRRMRPLLGTYVEVAADGPDPMPAIERAFAALESVQQVLSFQHPDSELSRLNAAPGRWQRLSPNTLRVLRLARAMTAASDQAFDCTLGGAMVRCGVLPDHGGTYLPRGRADDIEIAAGRARLARPVRITVDGIAKGYAVDRAIAALRRAGVTGGWVNAGGDMRVFGDCRLPVTRRHPNGTLTALGALTNAALASSQVGGAGDATVEGLAGRVLTGDNSPAAAPELVTVIAHSAWRADALTKVAAATSPRRRAAAVRQLGGWLVTEMNAGEL